MGCAFKKNNYNRGYNISFISNYNQETIKLSVKIRKNVCCLLALLVFANCFFLCGFTSNSLSAAQPQAANIVDSQSSIIALPEQGKVLTESSAAVANSAELSRVDKAVQSVKNSFSPASIARAAGVSLVWDLTYQILEGDELDLAGAIDRVLTLGTFTGMAGGTIMGAMAQVVTPALTSLIPVPGIAAALNSFVPVLAGFTGHSVGRQLGDGVSFLDAVRSIDLASTAAGVLGYQAGAALGALIPIPFFGSMIGGIVGYWAGQKIYDVVRGFFRPDETPPDEIEQPKGSDNTYHTSTQIQTDFSDYTPQGIRIDENVSDVRLSDMHPELLKLKNAYEKAYGDYVRALQSGDHELATEKLEEFRSISQYYHNALKSIR